MATYSGEELAAMLAPKSTTQQTQEASDTAMQRIQEAVSSQQNAAELAGSVAGNEQVAAAYSANTQQVTDTIKQQLLAPVENEAQTYALMARKASETGGAAFAQGLKELELARTRQNDHSFMGAILEQLPRFLGGTGTAEEHMALAGANFQQSDLVGKELAARGKAIAMERQARLQLLETNGDVQTAQTAERAAQLLNQASVSEYNAGVRQAAAGVEIAKQAGTASAEARAMSAENRTAAQTKRDEEIRALQIVQLKLNNEANAFDIKVKKQQYEAMGTAAKFLAGSYKNADGTPVSEERARVMFMSLPSTAQAEIMANAAGDHFGLGYIQTLNQLVGSQVAKGLVLDANIGNPVTVAMSSFLQDRTRSLSNGIYAANGEVDLAHPEVVAAMSQFGLDKNATSTQKQQALNAFFAEKARREFALARQSGESIMPIATSQPMTLIKNPGFASSIPQPILPALVSAPDWLTVSNNVGEMVRKGTLTPEAAARHLRDFSTKLMESEAKLGQYSRLGYKLPDSFKVQALGIDFLGGSSVRAVDYANMPAMILHFNKLKQQQEFAHTGDILHAAVKGAYPY